MTLPVERILNSILVLRGEKVMLDADLAAMYGVETRSLIQAIKRNPQRFPAEFHVPARPGRVGKLEITNWDLKFPRRPPHGALRIPE